MAHADPLLPVAQFPLDPQACYAAYCAKDASLDGVFYLGVRTTGIFCRPVCRARTPLFQNCRFFLSCQSAQAAGFRPCRRCRPELAPQAAAWSVEAVSKSLALRAAQLLTPFTSPDPGKPTAATAVSVAQVAAQLGISSRHLHRIMLQTTGLGPKAFMQQARVRHAKRLILEAALPMAQVAVLSGYTTLRAMQRALGQQQGVTSAKTRSAHATLTLPSSQPKIL